MKKTDLIILIGVAGAGKSVQGKLLARKLGYSWVSIGELLRSVADDDKLKDMLGGKLLNDQEIIDIVDKYLDSIKRDGLCILDGFPRTPTQADWLMEQNKIGRVSIRAVVHIEASRELVKERLLSRGRPDDNEKAINKRFEEYNKMTSPMIELFNKGYIPVYEISGENKIKQVHKRILELFS